MRDSIDAIYMVEASPELRAAQKRLLCGENAPMTESKVGYHSICKYNMLPIVWTETIKSIPIGMSSFTTPSACLPYTNLRAPGLSPPKIPLDSRSRILRRPPHPRLPMRVGPCLPIRPL